MNVLYTESFSFIFSSVLHLNFCAKSSIIFSLHLETLSPKPKVLKGADRSHAVQFLLVIILLSELLALHKPRSLQAQEPTNKLSFLRV